jgi:hypothetical protein
MCFFYNIQHRIITGDKVHVSQLLTPKRRRRLSTDDDDDNEGTPIKKSRILVLKMAPCANMGTWC